MTTCWLVGALLLLTAAAGKAADDTRADYIVLVVERGQPLILLTSENVTCHKDLRNFTKRFDDACNGYTGNETQPWVATFNLDVDDSSVRLVFECVEPFASIKLDLAVKLRLAKMLSNAFERNRPQRWFIDTNDILCTDHHGRRIPMPLGIRSCGMLHRSRRFLQTDADGNTTEVRKHKFSAGPANNLADQQYLSRCGDSYPWRPQPAKAPDVVPNESCVIRNEIYQASFYCCCYGHSSACTVNVLKDAGFTCPQFIRSITYNTTDPEGFYVDHKDNYRIMVPIEAVQRKTRCVQEVTLYRDQRTDDFHAMVEVPSLDYFSHECDTLETREISGCLPLKYGCYAVTNDHQLRERFCCYLKDRKDDGLLMHTVWTDYFLKRQAVYRKTDDCLNPTENKDYCYFFIDPVSKQRVNPRLDGDRDEVHKYRRSFVLTESSQRLYDAFLRESTITSRLETLELHGIVPEVAQDAMLERNCVASANRIIEMSVWMPFTVVLVKCRTAPDAPKRCDELVDVPMLVERYIRPKHSCYQKRGTPEGTFSPVCAEWIEVSEDLSETRLKQSDLLTELTPFMKELKPLWVAMDRGDDEDEWYCVNLLYDNVVISLHDGFRMAYVCLCLDASNCNTGHFVRNLYDIWTKPSLHIQHNDTFLGAGPAACNLRSDTSYRTCMPFLEVGEIQACVFGMGEHKTEVGIGCVRGTLNLRRIANRISTDEYHDYHIYMFNETVNVDYHDLKRPYRCVVRDNHFDPLVEPDIVCLCRAGACDEPHQQMMKKHKFKHIEDF